MTRRRRSFWIWAGVSLVAAACGGDDTETAGPGGAAGNGGVGGAGGSSETGGASGAGGDGGDGAGGTAGAAGSGGATGGSGGDASTPDARSDNVGGASGARDAAAETAPPVEAGEAGRCLAGGTHGVAIDGSAGYIIAGGALNAPITLCRGTTYTFNVNAPGHPFFIRKEGGEVFSSGVTGNHISVGNLVFAVPNDAPDLLFYQCQIHAWMVGAIVIVD